MGPKFHFGGFNSRKLGEHHLDPKGTFLRGMTRFEHLLVQIGCAV